MHRKRTFVLWLIVGGAAVTLTSCATTRTTSASTLTAKLIHEDIHVRIDAAELVREKGFKEEPPTDPAQVSALVRVAGKANPLGADSSVAWAASRVLEKTDPAVLWQGLEPTLSDPDGGIRRFALRSFLASYARIRAAVNETQDVDARLAPALLEKDADVVATALGYIYQHKVVAATPTLIKLFLDGDATMLSGTTGEGYIAIGFKVAWIDTTYLKDVNPDVMIEPSLAYRVYFALNALDPSWPQDPAVPVKVRALLPKIAEIEALRLKLLSLQILARKNDYCKAVGAIGTNYLLVKPNRTLGGIMQTVNAAMAGDALDCFKKIAEMAPADVETGLKIWDSFTANRKQYHALAAAFEQDLDTPQMQRFKWVLAMAFAHEFLQEGESDMQLCGPLPDDAMQLFLDVLAKEAADKLKEGAGK